MPSDVSVDTHHTLLATLKACAVGRFDPTTRFTEDGFWRATHTPHGPGTINIAYHRGGVEVTGFGPGGDWLVAHAGALGGDDDTETVLEPRHRVVEQAMHRIPIPRFGRTLTPFHDIVPVILAQRITALEAHRQWRRLCEQLGAPAPGPFGGLRLPPTPQAISSRPTWWYHPLGIEGHRARALLSAARHATRLVQHNASPAQEGREWLELLPGIGPWTSAHVAQISWGDPDAVIVGDYWLPHLVVQALTGRPRGTDAQMLELLEPWRGQRARVVRLLVGAGHRVQRRGPGHRVLPMHRW